MKNISAEQKNAGQRLDIFIASHFPNTTRSKIQKLIKQEKILVNGNIITPHYKIKGDEAIQIKTLDIRETISGEKLKKNENKNLFKKVKIIDENKDYIVVNKPAGLIVHGDEHILEKTLTDYLIEKYPQIKKVGDDPNRPGIVHRLDKDASGLMVIALNQKSFNDLKNQFKKRKVKKAYLALAHGSISKDSDIINFPISRSQKGFKMAANPKTFKKEVNETGRKAHTEFEIIQRLINYTLLRVKIKTGRTHQIRVHMSAYGNPLLGDDLYGTKTAREKNAKVGLGRIFLVAEELEFKDLEGAVKNYKIKLPIELSKILKIIK